jgi:hypothetical protein
MCPAIALNHSDRELLSPQLRPKLVVVANCGHSTEKVPNPTPPEANLLRHRPVPRDDLRELPMYVFAPLNIVPIGRVAKPWIKSELKMVVCIDETRHHQKVREVNLRTT